MSDSLSGIGWSDTTTATHRALERAQTLPEGSDGFSPSAIDQAPQLGRDFARDSAGANTATGQGFDSTVRSIGNQVDSTIRNGVRDAQAGIEQGVQQHGQQVHATAEFLRSQIPGDSVAAQAGRSLITGAETVQRFGAGVAGGIAREGVGLLGTAGELGSTTLQMTLSSSKRAEVGNAIVDRATSAYEYGKSVVNDPSRLLSDARSVYDAGSNAVQGVINNHQQAIEQGQGPEKFGLTAGQALTYVVPGSQVRGVARAGGEVLAREGTEALAQQGVRQLAQEGTEALPKITMEPGTRSYFRAQDFGNAVANDPLASRAYSIMQRNGVDVSLYNGGNNGLAGAYEPYKAKVGINTFYNPTVKDAMSTLVHEGTHVKFEGNVGNGWGLRGPQKGEYAARALEFYYNEGRRPNAAERALIQKEIRDLGY
jgi:hypothetical protein